MQAVIYQVVVIVAATMLSLINFLTHYRVRVEASSQIHWREAEAIRATASISHQDLADKVYTHGRVASLAALRRS